MNRFHSHGRGPSDGDPQSAIRGALGRSSSNPQSAIRIPQYLGPIGRPFRSPNVRIPNGFTLIELLVVMGIMAVLAGITVASYVGITQRASRQGARDNVMDVLRQARVSAVDTGRGAVVRLEPATATSPATVYGISSNVIGAWHFEEVSGTTTPGAQRYDGTFEDNAGNPAAAPVPVPGKLGLALPFDGSHFVDCGNASIWNQTTGIRLEAWVEPDADRAGTRQTTTGTSSPRRTAPARATSSGMAVLRQDCDLGGTRTASSSRPARPTRAAAYSCKSTESFPWGTWHSRGVRVSTASRRDSLSTGCWPHGTTTGERQRAASFSQLNRHLDRPGLHDACERRQPGDRSRAGGSVAHRLLPRRHRRAARHLHRRRHARRLAEAGGPGRQRRCRPLRRPGLPRPGIP